MFFAAPVGLVDGLAHGVGDLVGIHDHRAVQVAGRPAGGLCKGTGRPQEPFLVGIEDGHQRHLRQIKTFAQQVDTHQHVEEAPAQPVHDLHAFQRVDVGMDVTAADVQPGEVSVQLFRHAFGEGGHQYPLVAGRAAAYLFDEVIYLVEGGTYFDHGVGKAGGPDHLLHDDPFRALQLIFGRRGAHKDHLACQLFELLKFEGSVVDGRRQAEPIFHQHLLAGVVAAVHGPYLGQRDMALVDDRQEIVREIVQQTERTCPRRTAVKVTGVVLYAAAVSQLTDHLYVIAHPLFQAVCLLMLADLFEKGYLRLHVLRDLEKSFLHP